MASRCFLLVAAEPAAGNENGGAERRWQAPRRFRYGFASELASRPRCVPRVSSRARPPRTPGYGGEKAASEASIRSRLAEWLLRMPRLLTRLVRVPPVQDQRVTRAPIGDNFGRTLALGARLL